MSQVTLPDREKNNSDTITVIIPTYFGGKWLESVLDKISRQSVPVDELIIVDSGSRDNTLDIAGDYPVRLLQINSADFDHGGTRTMAAREAKGTILVYFTQDAIPENEQALANLVRPLRDNTNIAASYGRQLPCQDANPFSEHLRLFNYPEQSNTRCWEDRHKFGFKTIFISNSFAAYRKECLAEVGYFPEKIIFGEDTCTVARLLKQGYCVHYAGDARVYHSHNYTLVQDAKRYFDIGVLHALEKDMMDDFGAPTGAGKRFILSEISFLLTRKKYILIFQSFLRNGLKFVAYRLGRRYTMLPRSLARLLSMHHRWWK